MNVRHLAYETAAAASPEERAEMVTALRALAAEATGTGVELALGKAELLEGDLRAEFLVPTNLRGDFVSFGDYETQYGPKWRIAGEWVDPYVGRAETLHKKGFRRVLVLAPAWPMLRPAKRGGSAKVELARAHNWMEGAEIIGEVVGWSGGARIPTVRPLPAPDSVPVRDDLLEAARLVVHFADEYDHGADRELLEAAIEKLRTAVEKRGGGS